MEQPLKTYIQIVALATFTEARALRFDDPLVTMEGSGMREISRAVISHAEQQNRVEMLAVQKKEEEKQMVAGREPIVNLPKMQEEQSGHVLEGSSERQSSSSRVRGSYRSYNLEMKQKIVLQIKEELNKTGAPSQSSIIRAVAKKHGIHTKNVGRWFKAKELKAPNRHRKCQFPQMEAKLIDFLMEKRKEGKILKRCKVIQKAKAIMHELYPDALSVFRYSKGWYERFRARLERRITAEQLTSATLSSNQDVAASVHISSSVQFQSDVNDEIKIEEIEQANL